MLPTVQLSSSSTPSLTEFNPRIIPYQIEVIKSVRRRYDFQKGVHEILLSGSVGSAKSIVMAHVGVTHCLLNPGARLLIGRKSMPDLKSTLVAKIYEHIAPVLREGIDFELNQQTSMFTFSNGSEIIARSWADKNFKRFRSLELSAALIEELTENDGPYWPFYNELYARVGRLSHIKERFIMAATNPDSPRHPAYKHFISSKNPMRHVFYSKTEQNPFLPESYVNQLRETLDPKQKLRLLDGIWIEIDEEIVYYNYKTERNFVQERYVFNYDFPVDLSFDFNISAGKPMSAMAGQFINGKFHVGREYVVEGARTADIMEEIALSGILDRANKVRVFGDASGKSNNTRSIKSDYDIIKEFLCNYEKRDCAPNELQHLIVEMQVPLANPAVRERHNIQNAAFLNANGSVNFYVYRNAPTLDEGFRLTKLKKGASYIEDDSDYFQHLTTAASYWVHFLLIRYREKREAYRR